MAIPKHCYGKIEPRSGMASRGVTMRGGVMDSDYRGDFVVMLAYTGDAPYAYKANQAIAQLIIMSCNMTQPVQVDALDATERCAGGFGSTDAKNTAAAVAATEDLEMLTGDPDQPWGRETIPVRVAQQEYDHLRTHDSFAPDDQKPESWVEVKRSDQNSLNSLLPLSA